jgi:hypothetical protein
MAVSTYFSRNELNKDFILGLVQEKADRLVATEAAGQASSMMDSVGRVQSLMIYTLLRLFDGDARQRHLAEQHLPTLMRWAKTMLEQATSLTVRDGALLCHALNRDASRNASSNFASLEELLWRAWILSESVRRTWYMCTLVRNSYQWLKVGNVDCAGSLPITARSGVWQAKTAMMWMKMCAERSVDFSNRTDYRGLTLRRRVGEVDSFILAVMKVDLGPDTMELWKGISVS